MTPTDKRRFAELITGLARTFHVAMSAQDLENYWRFLQRYSLHAVESAVVNYCRSPEGHRFLPKPGELVAYLEGDPADQALQAWSKVMHAVRKIGAYRTVVFDDPLIHAVIWEMGGWQTLCATSIREEPFKAREFEKRYVRHRRYPPTGYPKQLMGITDTANAASGYSGSSAVILVGDRSKAMCVLQQGKAAHELLSFQSLSATQITRLLEKN